MILFQRIIIINLVLLVALFRVEAQGDDCTIKLDSARVFFENGLIENVPSTLWPCIEEGFSREQRISAYKLLVITYLFDGNQAEAERTMQQFIYDYPRYDIRPDDPVEFVYLYESYESVPKYSFGIRVGTNLGQPYKVNYQTVGISDQNTIKYHPGVQIAITSTAYVTRNIAVNLEAEIFQTNHEFINRLSGMSEVRFQETQNKIEIPLYFSYHFDVKEILPYAFLGGSLNFLISASGVPERIIPFDGDDEVLTGPELDITAQRNNIDFSGLAGFGAHYPLAKGSIFVDFRVSIGMKNQISGTRFENTALWSGYYHLDNDYAMIRYTFSIGYNYSFYKPEKVR